MKKFLSLTPFRCLFLLCLLTTTISVMASTPSKYSTTWTTSNHVYLYNKATGLYLATGGHWGTEGMLKATGLPVYMGSDHSITGDATGIAMYSKQDQSKRWGLVTSAESFDPIKNGLYCDASDSYTAQTFGFKYNSDDGTYSIYREGIENDNIAIKYTSDGTTYYLAPKVGDVTTLIWSTQPYFWVCDEYSIYAVSGTDTYKLYNNNGTLETSKSNGTSYTVNGSTLTFGDYYLTGGTKTLTTSSSNAASANIYNTSGQNVYLTQQGTNDARKNIVTELVCNGDIPDIARWYIVTKQDMIDDFESSTASEENPKEASFYLANSDLSRNLALGWTLTEDNRNAFSDNVPYTRFGDALYNIVGPTHSTGYINDVAQSTNVESSDGTVNTTTASYTDNGSGYKVTSDDVQYAGVAAGSTTYYHAIYGGYYNVRILSNGDGTKSGSTAARKMYQTVTGLKAGYYKFSGDGYVYNPSGASGTAYLYAKTSTSDVSTTLTQKDTYETMTQAGINFYNNGATSDYRKSVIVKVAEGESLEVGVSVSGGVFTNSAKGSVNTFAEVDGFKLEYLGTGTETYDIVLDETVANDADHTYTIDGKSVNYINAQICEETERILYLKRSMSAGKWNSLVLPVSITSSQLKSAFGDNVELAEFTKCEDNVITFSDVNLTTATPAIVAGTCYLVKPSSLNAQPSGTYTTKLAKDNTKSISVTAEPTSPVFVFNDMTFSEATEATSSTVFKPTYDASETGLQFEGTYFNTTEAIAPGSYAINAADGNWYRWTGSKSLDVKGFRAWIGVAPTSDAKLTMVINGVDADATEIADINIEQPTMQNCRIYNINGQLVGTAENVNNLPKGMYIMGGKKYIVK